MVKAIWVEDMNAVDRTNVLQDNLEKYGYKITFDDFINLLKEEIHIDKVVDFIKSFKDRKISLMTAINLDTPSIVGYGIMKCKNKNGFYISYMRRKPGGQPEIRLIIENEHEFKTWIKCFAQHAKHQYQIVYGNLKK